MPNKYILLWLEAPLQAWGYDSKFWVRESCEFPTKSGIEGLLLCALGASGPQEELLKRLASLKQTVVSYVSEDSKKRNGLPLTDFHMVGSGYNEKDEWEKLLIPKTIEGKSAVGGGSKLTYRKYLQNAKFAVIVEIPADLTARFSEALHNPVFDIYLGRKNCAPTDFIFRGVFDDENEAVLSATGIAVGKKLIENFTVVDGRDENKGAVLNLNDVPLQFGPDKVYRDRFVTIIRK